MLLFLAFCEFKERSIKISDSRIEARSAHHKEALIRVQNGRYSRDKEVESLVEDALLSLRRRRSNEL